MNTYPSAIRSMFIGFEPLFSYLENINHNSEGLGYPPHNLIRIDNDNCILEFAVAGFSENEIEIEVKDSDLIIRGEKKSKKYEDSQYIHKGISSRKFFRNFKLAEHVEVNDASLTNGILQISLKRIIPEEEKPKKIKIKALGSS